MSFTIGTVTAKVAASVLDTVVTGREYFVAEIAKIDGSLGAIKDSDGTVITESDQSATTETKFVHAELMDGSTALANYVVDYSSSPTTGYSTLVDIAANGKARIYVKFFSIPSNNNYTIKLFGGKGGTDTLTTIGINFIFVANLSAVMTSMVAGTSYDGDAAPIYSTLANSTGGRLKYDGIEATDGGSAVKMKYYTSETDLLAVKIAGGTGTYSSYAIKESDDSTADEFEILPVTGTAVVSTTTLTLATGFRIPLDDYYNGGKITFTMSTGEVVTKTISDYVGSNGLVTIGAALANTNITSYTFSEFFVIKSLGTSAGNKSATVLIYDTAGRILGDSDGKDGLLLNFVFAAAPTISSSRNVGVKTIDGNFYASITTFGDATTVATIAATGGYTAESPTLTVTDTGDAIFDIATNGATNTYEIKSATTHAKGAGDNADPTDGDNRTALGGNITLTSGTSVNIKRKDLFDGITESWGVYQNLELTSASVKVSKVAPHDGSSWSNTTDVVANYYNDGSAVYSNQLHHGEFVSNNLSQVFLTVAKRYGLGAITAANRAYTETGGFAIADDVDYVATTGVAAGDLSITASSVVYSVRGTGLDNTGSAVSYTLNLSYKDTHDVATTLSSAITLTVYQAFSQATSVPATVESFTLSEKLGTDEPIITLGTVAIVTKTCSAAVGTGVFFKSEAGHTIAVGDLVITTGGTGSGQQRVIVSGSAPNYTVSRAWTTGLDDTTTYKVTNNINLGMVGGKANYSISAGSGTIPANSALTQTSSGTDLDTTYLIVTHGSNAVTGVSSGVFNYVLTSGIKVADAIAREHTITFAAGTSTLKFVQPLELTLGADTDNISRVALSAANVAVDFAAPATLAKIPFSITYTGGTVSDENSALKSARVLGGALTGSGLGNTQTYNDESQISTTGYGVGAVFKVESKDNGSVDAITVTTVGYGYKTGDVLSFSVNSQNVTATLVADDLHATKSYRIPLTNVVYTDTSSTGGTNNSGIITASNTPDYTANSTTADFTLSALPASNALMSSIWTLAATADGSGRLIAGTSGRKVFYFAQDAAITFTKHTGQTGQYILLERTTAKTQFNGDITGISGDIITLAAAANATPNFYVGLPFFVNNVDKGPILPHATAKKITLPSDHGLSGGDTYVIGVPGSGAGNYTGTVYMYSNTTDLRMFDVTFDNDFDNLGWADSAESAVFTAAGGGSNTITKPNGDSTSEADKVIVTKSGTGAGQSRLITGVSGNTVTVSPNWGTNPASDTTYVVTSGTIVGSDEQVTGQGIQVGVSSSFIELIEEDGTTIAAATTFPALDASFNSGADLTGSLNADSTLVSTKLRIASATNFNAAGKVVAVGQTVVITSGNGKNITFTVGAKVDDNTLESSEAFTNTEVGKILSGDGFTVKAKRIVRVGVKASKLDGETHTAATSDLTFTSYLIMEADSGGAKQIEAYDGSTNVSNYSVVGLVGAARPAEESQRFMGDTVIPPQFDFKELVRSASLAGAHDIIQDAPVVHGEEEYFESEIKTNSQVGAVIDITNNGLVPHGEVKRMVIGFDTSGENYTDSSGGSGVAIVDNSKKIQIKGVTYHKAGSEATSGYGIKVAAGFSAVLTPKLGVSSGITVTDPGSAQTSFTTDGDLSKYYNVGDTVYTNATLTESWGTFASATATTLVLAVSIDIGANKTPYIPTEWYVQAPLQTSSENYRYMIVQMAVTDPTLYDDTDRRKLVDFHLQLKTVDDSGTQIGAAFGRDKTHSLKRNFTSFVVMPLESDTTKSAMNYQRVVNPLVAENPLLTGKTSTPALSTISSGGLGDLNTLWAARYTAEFNVTMAGETIATAGQSENTKGGDYPITYAVDNQVLPGSSKQFAEEVESSATADPKTAVQATDTIVMNFGSGKIVRSDLVTAQNSTNDFKIPQALTIRYDAAGQRSSGAVTDEDQHVLLYNQPWATVDSGSAVFPVYDSSLTGYNMAKKFAVVQGGSASVSIGIKGGRAIFDAADTSAISTNPAAGITFPAYTAKMYAFLEDAAWDDESAITKSNTAALATAGSNLDTIHSTPAIPLHSWASGTLENSSDTNCFKNVRYRFLPFVTDNLPGSRGSSYTATHNQIGYVTKGVPSTGMLPDGTTGPTYNSVLYKADDQVADFKPVDICTETGLVADFVTALLVAYNTTSSNNWGVTVDLTNKNISGNTAALATSNLSNNDTNSGLTPYVFSGYYMRMGNDTVPTNIDNIYTAAEQKYRMGFRLTAPGEFGNSTCHSIRFVTTLTSGGSLTTTQQSGMAGKCIFTAFYKNASTGDALSSYMTDTATITTATSTTVTWTDSVQAGGTFAGHVMSVYSGTGVNSTFRVVKTHTKDGSNVHTVTFTAAYAEGDSNDLHTDSKLFFSNPRAAYDKAKDSYRVGIKFNANSTQHLSGTDISAVITVKDYAGTEITRTYTNMNLSGVVSTWSVSGLAADQILVNRPIYTTTGTAVGGGYAVDESPYETLSLDDNKEFASNVAITGLTTTGGGAFALRVIGVVDKDDVITDSKALTLNSNLAGVGVNPDPSESAVTWLAFTLGDNIHFTSETEAAVATDDLILEITDSASVDHTTEHHPVDSGLTADGAKAAGSASITASASAATLFPIGTRVFSGDDATGDTYIGLVSAVSTVTVTINGNTKAALADGDKLFYTKNKGAIAGVTDTEKTVGTTFSAGATSVVASGDISAHFDPGDLIYSQDPGDSDKTKLLGTVKSVSTSTITLTGEGAAYAGSATGKKIYKEGGGLPEGNFTIKTLKLRADITRKQDFGSRVETLYTDADNDTKNEGIAWDNASPSFTYIIQQREISSSGSNYIRIAAVGLGAITSVPMPVLNMRSSFADRIVFASPATPTLSGTPADSYDVQVLGRGVTSASDTSSFQLFDKKDDCTWAEAVTFFNLPLPMRQSGIAKHTSSDVMFEYRFAVRLNDANTGLSSTYFSNDNDGYVFSQVFRLFTPGLSSDADVFLDSGLTFTASASANQDSAITTSGDPRTHFHVGSLVYKSNGDTYGVVNVITSSSVTFGGGTLHNGNDLAAVGLQLAITSGDKLYFKNQNADLANNTGIYFTGLGTTHRQLTLRSGSDGELHTGEIVRASTARTTTSNTNMGYFNLFKSIVQLDHAH
jgi:hypothetical protein